MSTLFTHYLIRLKASCMDPYALIVLLGTGLAGILYWPGLVDPSKIEWVIISKDKGINELLLMLLWVFALPMLAGSIAGGAVAASGREAFALRGLPSLPITKRTRILGETLLVLTFMALARMPICLIDESILRWIYLPGHLNTDAFSRSAFYHRSLYGTMMMIPFIMVWAAPARTIQFYFLVRPFVLVSLFFAAAVLGFLATPLSCLATCFVLSLLVLFTVDMEYKLPESRRKPASAPGTRWRQGRNPVTQLRRDLWLKPLPIASIFLALEGGLIVLDRIVTFPEFGFYICSTLVLGFFFSFVVLRPMNSNLIMAGISGGSPSMKTGDFLSSMSVLPVKSESILRGVYLHGLITGTLLWAAVIATNLLSTWLELGEAKLIDFDGDHAGKYLIPYIALVPCIAGGLTCAAKGDVLLGFISLGTTIGVFMGHIMCLVFNLPVPIHAGILILLAATGGLPPLKHLRARRSLKGMEQ